MSRSDGKQRRNERYPMCNIGGICEKEYLKNDHFAYRMRTLSVYEEVISTVAGGVGYLPVGIFAVFRITRVYPVYGDV